MRPVAENLSRLSSFCAFQSGTIQLQVWCFCRCGLEVQLDWLEEKKKPPDFRGLEHRSGDTKVALRFSKLTVRKLSAERWVSGLNLQT